MADPADPGPAGDTDPGAPPPADPAELAKKLEKALAELETWKGEARKHEERSKANNDAAKRLKELERSSMTDLEQAVATAREEAETAAARKWGAQLVGAEVRAAAAHLAPEQQAAIAEAIDPAKFLTADGDVDSEAIGAWVTRAYPRPVEDPEAPPAPPGFPALAQGAVGTPVVPPQESGLVGLIKSNLGIP